MEMSAAIHLRLYHLKRMEHAKYSLYEKRTERDRSGSTDAGVSISHTALQKSTRAEAQSCCSRREVKIKIKSQNGGLAWKMFLRKDGSAAPQGASIVPFP